jgi:hypothetical protein
MARKKELINKTVEKKTTGRCLFCGENDYALLDCHRIIPGEEKGRYIKSNVTVACSNCHRKIHDGQIKIDRWYPSTAGRMLHYWLDGQEIWLPENQ